VHQLVNKNFVGIKMHGTTVEKKEKMKFLCLCKQVSKSLSPVKSCVESTSSPSAFSWKQLQ